MVHTGLELTDRDDGTLSTRKKKGFNVKRITTFSSIQIGIHPWEKPSTHLLKAALAEFVCMTIFIYATIGAICFGCHSSDVATGAKTSAGTISAPADCFLSSSRALTIAASFGFSIAVMVYAAASFSGGHLNPAVTLAACLTRKVSLPRALIYFVAQIGGALLGAFFVSITDPTGFHAGAGGTNRLLAGQSQGGAWLLEFMLTGLLVFVVFAATDTHRATTSAHLPVLAPFAIGFAVFVCHLAAIPLDGCSINPARSLGPAVIIGKFEHQWIFWVGPFSGAIFAAFVYELCFRPFQAQLIAAGEQKPMEDTGQAVLPAYAGFHGVNEWHGDEEETSEDSPLTDHSHTEARFVQAEEGTAGPPRIHPEVLSTTRRT